MERKYYSIPEAAAMLGISRIAVFKQVKKGRIAAIRIGRNWAIAISELNKAKGGGVKPVKAAPAVPPRPAVKKPVAREENISDNADLDSMGWD